MTDPCDVSFHQKLILISTGIYAPRDIESSLINVADDGANMAKSFINGALAEDQNGNHYGPITRLKLKTFKNLTKKLKCLSQHDQEFSAFVASLTASKTLGAGEIVKFNKVWTNVNNDYDSSTGVYTAPKPGVYQFSCSVMTQHGKTLRVFLWKNDMKTVAAYPGSDNHNMGSLNMVLELKKGDKVYIKQGGPEKYIYSEPASNFNMFSGYLIR
ncbi:unnamed protein product [Mytilus coruscus]|uniref:C1q domain-containing protein n=1 Tax=Mytilus coruscus TaxID=42192 RepID=A0A6J8DSP6_MYTCO|nr:unnamed protein product [Mytilus coruscus]